MPFFRNSIHQDIRNCIIYKMSCPRTHSIRVGISFNEAIHHVLPCLYPPDISRNHFNRNAIPFNNQIMVSPRHPVLFKSSIVAASIAAEYDTTSQSASKKQNPPKGKGVSHLLLIFQRSVSAHSSSSDLSFFVVLLPPLPTGTRQHHGDIKWLTPFFSFSRLWRTGSHGPRRQPECANDRAEHGSSTG